MKEITTERLVLTPWRDCQEDALGLYSYAKDPEVGPRAGWKPHESVEESREIIRNVFMPHAVWAIREKESGRIVGSIGLEPDRRREDVSSKEMGYSLGREFWGRGYMTEAAVAVMDYGFREFNLTVMAICTSPDNKRSQRVIEKCGFKFEGRQRRGYRIYDGSDRDNMVYSILREEWKDSVEDKIIYTVTGDTAFDNENISEMKALEPDCILILGAGITDKDTPSPMLKDRLDAGIQIYKEGVASKILLSGDNGQQEHNEIHVMLKYAKEAGVPEEDIFCDHAGFSTYDSMYRASSIFGVERAIVVTQKYHQYRALYVGEELGLDVWGVASDQEEYAGQSYRDLREILARIKDFGKAAIKSESVLGGEVIPISGSGIISHGE